MKGVLTIALIMAAAVGPVYAECSYPPPPEKIPDGNNATLEEMVTAQKAVKEYDKAINAYVSCIQLERDDAVSKVTAAGQKPTAEQQKAVDTIKRVEVQKHNAAIDQLQSVADRFNTQVKVYKARTDKSKG